MLSTSTQSAEWLVWCLHCSRRLLFFFHALALWPRGSYPLGTGTVPGAVVSLFSQIRINCGMRVNSPCVAPHCPLIARLQMVPRTPCALAPAVSCSCPTNPGLAPFPQPPPLPLLGTEPRHLWRLQHAASLSRSTCHLVGPGEPWVPG